jgi:hypothetical protein
MVPLFIVLLSFAKFILLPICQNSLKSDHRLQEFPFTASNFIEAGITRPDGQKRELEVSVSPIRDRYGKITGFRGTARDITERKQVEERLRYLSIHDALTGLYNRAYFEEGPGGRRRVCGHTAGNQQSDCGKRLPANQGKHCGAQSPKSRITPQYFPGVDHDGKQK